MTARARLAALAVAGCVAAAPAAPAPSAEDRVHALATELRCPVCQNQNLTDSNSDLARDLRQEIARQVQAGRSDEQVRRFMVERYGHYVLYDPPLTRHTLLLWSAPAVLLLGAAVVGWRRARPAREAGP